jgi:hypothetical protein
MFKANSIMAVMVVLVAVQVQAKSAGAGWNFSFTPALTVNKGYDPGIGVDPEFKYGVSAGPLLLSAGARSGIYYAQNLFGVTLMPVVQLTLPGESFDTYVAFGHGLGTLPNNDHTDKATMSRIGVLIHFSEKFSLSIEGTNQNIYNSEFSFVSFGSRVIYEF